MNVGFSPRFDLIAVSITSMLLSYFSMLTFVLVDLSEDTGNGYIQNFSFSHGHFSKLSCSNPSIFVLFLSLTCLLYFYLCLWWHILYGIAWYELFL